MVNSDIAAGWHSMQIEWMLEKYVEGSKQDYINQYLSGLRPEIATVLVEDANELFIPETAQLVKQFKEEWQDGTE